MVIWIEPIRRKLFDVSLGQTSELGLSQTLSEVKQSLWGRKKKHQPQQKNSHTVNIETKAYKDEPRNFPLLHRLRPARD